MALNLEDTVSMEGDSSPTLGSFLCANFLRSRVVDVYSIQPIFWGRSFSISRFLHFGTKVYTFREQSSSNFKDSFGLSTTPVKQSKSKTRQQEMSCTADGRIA